MLIITIRAGNPPSKWEGALWSSPASRSDNWKMWEMSMLPIVNFCHIHWLPMWEMQKILEYPLETISIQDSRSMIMGVVKKFWSTEFKTHDHNLSKSVFRQTIQKIPLNVMTLEIVTKRVYTAKVTHRFTIQCKAMHIYERVTRCMETQGIVMQNILLYRHYIL